MTVLGKAIATINRLVRPVGVMLTRPRVDFEDFFAPGPMRRLMCRRLAAVAEPFLREEAILPCPVRFDVEEAIVAFLDAYLESPVRVAEGGSRFNNLLWLHLLRRAMGCRLAVDSGSFVGSSAWALAFGEDRPQVHSFDIDLSRVQVSQENIRFHKQDWTTFEFQEDLSSALCYFDDHVDQVRRVIEAAERGIRYCIFDDDLSVTAVPIMAPTPSPLPKLEFLFDNTLKHGEKIEWRHNGRSNTYRIDQDYLEQARRRINGVQRLPDMSYINCVIQLPYKLVVLS